MVFLPVVVLVRHALVHGSVGLDVDNVAHAVHGQVGGELDCSLLAEVSGKEMSGAGPETE